MIYPPSPSDWATMLIRFAAHHGTDPLQEFDRVRADFASAGMPWQAERADATRAAIVAITAKP